MNRLLSFKEKDTWIHRLSGVTKLLFFLLWCITSALTYDIRVLIAMIIISLTIFVISKTEWKQVSTVFKLVMFFMVLNVIAIFIMSPYQGRDLREQNYSRPVPPRPCADAGRAFLSV